MKIKIDQEAFNDAMQDAVERTLLKLLPDTTDAEKQKFLNGIMPDVQMELESFIGEAVKRAARPASNPVGPVLDFGRIRLWVYDAGQPCVVGEHRSFQFGGDHTAGLVYEELDHGHRAMEYNINNESTWKWIHEWMYKGFKAEGLLGEDGKLKSAETNLTPMPQ